jgi:hypothetical protein
MQWFGIVLGKLHHLAFRNTSDLVQVKPALAFRFFGIHRRAKKRIRDHGDSGKRRSRNRGNHFPISNQALQRSDPQPFLNTGERAMCHKNPSAQRARPSGNPKRTYFNQLLPPN